MFILMYYHGEESCYVGAELFVFPMAAYERALLLINRHLNEVCAVSEQATNFEFLKQVMLRESF